ncbi:hypothetical protein [Chryseobacterium sp. c4a]|uniref:hypothetical protein n=1 Tax=Chryseobacterium sp. c4a TaxID=1573582 RepID=UPI0013585540|nr:hypothetical protein [Chryseobacterium sp. c4a]
MMKYYLILLISILLSCSDKQKEKPFSSPETEHLRSVDKSVQSTKVEEKKHIEAEIDTAYSIITQKQADINQDGKPDQITVYGTEWNKEIKPTDCRLFRVVVIVSNNKNKLITLTNDSIIRPYYPENVAAGFSDLKIKDNYFTIEQSNGGGGIIETGFTTFKYDKTKKGIYLHRYTTLTSEMSSGDEKEYKTELTTKNFGVIPFESFNVKTINSK